MKMGFAECDVVMESRMGSVSSGMGSRSDVRGQIWKSSPFCSRSSSKIAQSIIKDHMVSHYKKVYSAKAAIDASVPKSLLYSVKYNDQIKQERLRKGGRPQSAHSLSQRNSRTSCSSTQSRSSVQYQESHYLSSRSSMTSSPKFNTSFNAKEITYPSYKRSSHSARPASEIMYRSPGATLRRRQSACSLGAVGDQSPFKTFQDPVQKTYSGDLLQKHSQRFTQDKPFVPKTLKSDKSSYLSKYRYYRAPQRKPTQHCSNTSPENKESTQKFDETSQELTTEHEWSEDDFNDSHLSTCRPQSRAVRTRDRPVFGSSPRFSPERRKWPRPSGVSAEEEELLYLEFISAVTDDILARGHISDRVIERVSQRHIDMNLHKLDEGKMRHLLDVLRKDFNEPTDLSTSSVQLHAKESRHLDSLLSHLGPRVKPKEDNDVSLHKHSTPFKFDDPLMVSTPVFSPRRASPTEETDQKEDNEDEGTGSPLLSEHDAATSEEDVNQTDTTAINGVATGESESGDVPPEGERQAEDVEDLGRRLSESLHVSSNTHCEKEEEEEEDEEDEEEVASAAEQTNAATFSDDEF